MNGQIEAENPVQINLANFSVTMAKSNPQSEHRNVPPKRPPPPRIGFLRRPIPIAPVDDGNKMASVYTISPARQSIADFNLILKKPEPIFADKHRRSNGRQIWLRRGLIASGILLLIFLVLFVILEFTTASHGGERGNNQQTQ